MTTLKGSATNKMSAQQGIVKVQKRVLPILTQLNQLEKEGIFRAYSLKEENITKLRETLLLAVHTTVDAIEDEMVKVHDGVPEEKGQEPSFEF